MFDPTIGHSRPMMLAALVLSMALPLTLGTTAVAQTSCDELGTVGFITTGHPLIEELTAGELLYFVVMDSTSTTRPLRGYVNGLDALVVDLQCDVTAATFVVNGDDGGQGQCDPAVKFYDSSLNDKGLRNAGGGTTESGSVPAGSRYAVVILEDGPVFTGLTPGINPGTGLLRPYSCRIEFSMNI